MILSHALFRCWLSSCIPCGRVSAGKNQWRVLLGINRFVGIVCCLLVCVKVFRIKQLVSFHAYLYLTSWYTRFLRQKLMRKRCCDVLEDMRYLVVCKEVMSQVPFEARNISPVLVCCEFFSCYFVVAGNC